MSHLYEPFLSRVRSGGRLLDAGAGSGRDLREFASRGYLAEGIDASPHMARLATAYSGAPCAVTRLEDFAETAKYDGIWACASLLHLPRVSLPGVLEGLRRALVPRGILFASVQEGVGERVLPDGRFYSLYRPDEFEQALESAGLSPDVIWGTQDVLRANEAPRWVNVIATAR